jgi:hypothetical protein
MLPMSANECRPAQRSAVGDTPLPEPNKPPTLGVLQVRVGVSDSRFPPTAPRTPRKNPLGVVKTENSRV